MMPTEDDLRAMFDRERHADAGAGGLDAKQVIRRSRARRLPKQLATGGAGALVLVGVTVLGLQSVDLAPQQQTAEAPFLQEGDDGGAGGEAEDSSMADKRMPASMLNRCGEPVMPFEPSFVGLVLDVVFPAAAPASAERIDGIVIMTNESTETVTGTTLVNPAITLSQDGITVWHTNGPVDTIGTSVDLAPGASMEFPASFEPVRCGPEDETLEAFRADLPPAGAGAYEVSAALDFSSDQITETTEAFLVTGPPMPIVLE